MLAERGQRLVCAPPASEPWHGGGNEEGTRETASPLRVLVVDRCSAVGLRLQMLLWGTAGVELIAGADDPPSPAAQPAPEVVVMGVPIPGPRGATRIDAFLFAWDGGGRRTPGREALRRAFLAALEAGTLGYLPEAMSRQALIDAVHRFGRRPQRVAGWRRSRPALRVCGPLDGRQVALLRRLAEGWSNRRLAAPGGPAAAAEVATQVEDLFHKLGAGELVEATFHALLNNARRGPARPPGR